jgi:hypothetical protein
MYKVAIIKQKNYTVGAVPKFKFAKKTKTTQKPPYKTNKVT